jgi:hypothetical protein
MQLQKKFQETLKNVDTENHMAEWWVCQKRNKERNHKVGKYTETYKHRQQLSK